MQNMYFFHSSPRESLGGNLFVVEDSACGWGWLDGYYFFFGLGELTSVFLRRGRGAFEPLLRACGGLRSEVPVINEKFLTGNVELHAARM